MRRRRQNVFIYLLRWRVLDFIDSIWALNPQPRTCQVRVRVKGRQAIPRLDPGTLLNQCRLHKTQKHTHGLMP
jgi:hypothetical protein